MIDHVSQYSANVAAVLIIDGQRLELTKLSPTAVYLKKGAELRSGPAVIELIIDQTVQKMDVDLFNGAVPFENEVLIRALPQRA